MKRIVIPWIGYTVATFAIAVVWHVLLFEQYYLSVGYFGESPNFLLGFLSILIQGFVLSYGYSFLKVKVWPYVGLAFLFFWTSHVLAFMAKNVVPWSFLFMESFYLVLQFGIYGLVLMWVFKK